MTPQEYFENQRKEIAGKTYYITKEAVDKYVSCIPLPSREATRKVWMNRVGKTIGFVQDEQMEQYKQMLIPYLDDCDKKFVSQVFFGVVPFARSFNAFSEWSFRDGNYLITLNDGLCHLISVFCHTYSIVSGKGHSEFLYDNFDGLVKYLRNMGSATSFEGVFWGVEHSKTVSDWIYSENLTVACIHFIMGHELGHIENRDVETKIKSLNYKAEFAADEKGALICYGASQKEPNLYDIYLLAPFLALNMLKIWEKRPSNTHPLVDDRLNKIEEIYRDRLKIRGAIFEDIMNDVRRLGGFFEDLREETLNDR